MKSIQLYLQSRISSFGFAFNGLYSFFKQEPNARIHLAFTFAILAAAIYFKVSAMEAIALLIAIGMVLVAEIFNTAIEHIMDFISTEKNEHIKFIKDLAACGVLLSAIAALITGLIVFLPKIF
jgi:diacylglycerol kinase